MRNLQVSTTRLRPWQWFVTSLLLTVGVLTAVPAAAQSPAQDPAASVAPTATIVSVNDSESPARAMVFSTLQDSSDARITIDGEDVSATATTSTNESTPTEIVYVVDVNRRSARAEAFESIKSSVESSMSELPATAEVAVVAAGDGPVVTTELTADRAVAAEAIQQLDFRRRTDLHGSVLRATELFSEREGVVRSVVVVATGPTTETQASSARSQSALVRSGAQLVAVQYEGGDPDLEVVSVTSGGTAVTAGSVDAIGDAVREAASAAGQRVIVPFEAPEGKAGVRTNASLTIGEIKQDFSYINGLNSTRISQIGDPISQQGAGSVFRGILVLTGLVFLAFVGIGLAVWALSSMFVGGRRLDNLMSRYEANDPTMTEDETREAVVQSALVRRAVQISENFAEKQGFLVRIENTLERANLPIRAGEAVVFFFVGVILAFGLGLLLTGSLVGAFILAIVTGGLSYVALNFLAARRLKKFEAQLPDTLQLLAGTLRAGFSLPQGIDAVATEIAPPMGDELRRAVTEAQLGRDLEDSLEGISQRVASPDFAWAVMAISIQREVGGNLNELLMTVSETMIARERLRREVSALTAEGRMSALILGLLPPGLGTVLGLGNPDYIGKLFTDTKGNFLLGGAVLMALIGLAWMKKVITLNV